MKTLFMANKKVSVILLALALTGVYSWGKSLFHKGKSAKDPSKWTQELRGKSESIIASEMGFTENK